MITTLFKTLFNTKCIMISSKFAALCTINTDDSGNSDIILVLKWFKQYGVY